MINVTGILLRGDAHPRGIRFTEKKAESKILENREALQGIMENVGVGDVVPRGSDDDFRMIPP